MSTAKQNPMSSVFSVDLGMLLATLLALVGYLLPWFRPRPRAQWSFSGWAYASPDDGSGGGWTLLTFGWLLLAAGAALWARQVMAAAMAGMVAAVGTLVTAMAVVAASFGMIGERSALDYVTELPFGAGIPIMAAGIGLLLATSCRAIVRCHLPEATLERPAPPTP